MRWRWLGVFVPVGGMFVLAVLVNLFSDYNPVFYMRASLSVLLVFLGLFVSLIWAGVVWQQQNRLRRQQVMADFRQQVAVERRRFWQRLDHELKNPLTAIRTGVANMVEAPTAAARQQALETVEAQTVRLSRLTANLRKIADLETRPLELGAVNLSELLTELGELIGALPAMAARYLTLSIPQAPWPLPVIRGDYDLLFLAFYNVLENGVKYTEPGDRLELRAREDGRFVVVEVADTGPGIAAIELEHVWEELYRGRAVKHVPGSGLGLSLVRAIVERHQGMVSIHSRPGQGTLVMFQLPIEGL